jgi:hypothetical protein
LHIVGGSITIDNIIDPSTVTLDSPFNNVYLNSSTVIFNCSETDTLMLSNVTLYGNWTGSWQANETQNVSGTANITIFTKAITDGRYIWNCLVINNQSVSTFNPSNFTFTVDTIAPQAGITYPLNTSYNTNISTLNYTFSDVNSNNCWYSTNGGITNLSIDGCGTTFNNVSSKEGLNVWVFYANDSAGNLNSTSVSFTEDLTLPIISFNCDKTAVNIETEKITCNCLATDSLSSNITLSYTANPPVTSTGNFANVCTATDAAGNLATARFVYNIYRPGMNFGPGMTYILNNYILSKGYSINLGVYDKLTMQINNEIHFLNIVSLASNQAMINVSSTPQQIILSVDETKRMEITGDNYYDLSIKLNAIANNQANLTITSIHEQILPTTETTQNINNQTNWIAYLVGIAVLIALIIVAFIIFKKIKNRKAKLKSRLSKKKKSSKI